jgi:hypothetical protein
VQWVEYSHFIPYNTGTKCCSESATAPISRSSGCFCSSCRALGTRCCGCIELVDLVVALGNLLRFLGSSWLPPSLDICCRWLCLYQGDLFLGREVQNLDSQTCEQCDAVESVFLRPVKDVLVLQLVGVLSYFLTPLQSIA